MQKVLILSTSFRVLRSKVIAQAHEDSDNVNKAYVHSLGTANEYSHPNAVPEAMISSEAGIPYSTPLHALADGWKLLSPPVKRAEEWDWWLVKDLLESSYK